ncbi:MAG: ferric reductase-like transmembrane domain-containing protein [Acidimicrobiales bacterium]
MTTQHLLWYVTRGTGLVTLVLFSAVVALGVLTAGRVSTHKWPRFAWQELHRRLSLIAAVFLGLHIATTVLDTYVPISWFSAIVPFNTPYKTFWLGLGTIAVDLFLAVGITSMLRSRIPARVWRTVHWLAYLSWPVAVAHGLGMGTDRVTSWVLWLNIVCIAAVVGAVSWRFAGGAGALSRIGPSEVATFR